MTERSDLNLDPEEMNDEELETVTGGVTITNNHLDPRVNITNNHRTVPELAIPTFPDPWIVPEP